LDRQRAEALKLDPKENAEHAMLVDLARNDLSRSCRDVRVDVSREIQFYSHVIHLVSKVSGELQDKSRPFRMLADSFPAGTLSGAPKYRAMQILDTHEPVARQFYGGCLGFVGFNGDATLAIIIRSFLSYRQTLHYQSGFGFVFDSKPEQELEEANHKVGALRAALSRAESL
jgi:anthranilate synthase component 1